MFLRYLDDLQIGISARELMEFQEKADLEDADLATSCQDPDCCSFVGDLSPHMGKTGFGTKVLVMN